jgi:class 3 adenylate cyclase
VPQDSDKPPASLTTARCLPIIDAMPEDRARTRPAETRWLAALMFTDIVGFSRQMGANEARCFNSDDYKGGVAAFRPKRRPQLRGK